MNRSFITAEGISVRLREQLILKGVDWEMGSHEHWAFLGPNGSGKSTLVRALWGGVPLQKGRVIPHFLGKGRTFESFRDQVGYVSFELQQRLMEHEGYQADKRFFAGDLEGFTSAEEVMMSGLSEEDFTSVSVEERLKEVLALLGIEYLRSREVTALSTGEMRKTLIARALMKTPQLLILDEPFDGLDQSSRADLSEAIDRLFSLDMRVVLIAHRLEEVSPGITHVLLLKDGSVYRQGKKQEVLTSENASGLYDCDLTVKCNQDRYSFSYQISEESDLDLQSLFKGVSFPVSDQLIEMKGVRVEYGDVVALSSLDWTMEWGQNWAVLGPNGSGKSTLMKLILGDNVQGYANNIRLFGVQKGSGESVWELKKKMGYVSGEFQVRYRQNMSAFDVICSGFYDSIGLYQYPTQEQEQVADQWVQILRLQDLVQKNFHHLSYGQKRMILLARAMVKSPVLLIVDEPCHGLDIRNRARILEIIERIGESPTHLLLVTHHQEEIVPSITHVLELKRGKVISQGKK